MPSRTPPAVAAAAVFGAVFAPFCLVLGLVALNAGPPDSAGDWVWRVSPSGARAALVALGGLSALSLAAAVALARRRGE